MKRLAHLGKSLNKLEQKRIYGGMAPVSGGTANCGSGSVSISSCNGTTTCQDNVGCKCVGATASLTKCCSGNNCNPGNPA